MQARGFHNWKRWKIKGPYFRTLFNTGWYDRLQLLPNKFVLTSVLFRNYAVLLSFLIHTTDLLQNVELRLLLKSKLVDVCHQFISQKLYGIAGVLLNILFLTTVAEVTYLDDVDIDNIDSIWNNFLNSKVPWIIIIFLAFCINLLLALFLLIFYFPIHKWTWRYVMVSFNSQLPGTFRLFRPLGNFQLCYCRHFF